jgi:reactive intermediate/imine deaminase
MSARRTITTDLAPRAIGTYSQAVQWGETLYLSGQIPLDPVTMALVSGDFEAEARQVFENLKAVVGAAGGHMDDFVKVNVYLVDLANFATVNAVMAEYFAEPYPARAAVQVAGLPRGAQIEIDGVAVLRG